VVYIWELFFMSLNFPMRVVMSYLQIYPLPSMLLKGM